MSTMHNSDSTESDWMDSFESWLVSTTHVAEIDDREHRRGCGCGCDGQATVINEAGSDDAYIASTVDASTYLTRGRDND